MRRTGIVLGQFVGRLVVHVERRTQGEPHVVQRGHPRVGLLVGELDVAALRRQGVEQFRGHAQLGVQHLRLVQRPQGGRRVDVLLRGVIRVELVEVGQQPGQHRVVRALGRPRLDAGQLGELVLRRLLRASPEHVVDLTDQAAQHRGLLLFESREYAAALAAPALHACSIVAHRPAACSFATSPSTFSLLPEVTMALPLWWTSSISFVAWSRLYPNSFWNTYVTYDIRLTGSFHTMVCHGLSSALVPSPSVCSASTGVVMPSMLS